MSDLADAELTNDQLTMLRAIAASFIADRSWPSWHFIEFSMEQAGLDARQLLQGLPRVGDEHGPYGLIWPLPRSETSIGSDERFSLSVAAARWVPELGPLLAEPYLAALRAMIDKRLGHRPGPQDTAPPVMTAADLPSSFADLPDGLSAVVARLPALLYTEPATRHGAPHDSAGPDWQQTLNPEVVKYRDVRTLEDYVRRVSALKNEAAAERRPGAQASGLHMSALRESLLPWPHVVEASLAAARDGGEAYIRADQVQELREAGEASGWAVDKLLALVGELNSNVAAGHPYACLALIRAIMDHVPPVLDPKAPKSTFAAAVSQLGAEVSFTDKRHLQALVNSRSLGDDVMHRQASKDWSLLDTASLPSPLLVRTLIKIVIKMLG